MHPFEYKEAAKISAKQVDNKGLPELILEFEHNGNGFHKELFVIQLDDLKILFRTEMEAYGQHVYGEELEYGIQFMSPIQLNGYVQIMAPTNKLLGSSLVKQDEPGNMKFSIYQKTLDDMQVNILMGDYFGYYESEDKVRYYTVIDDGLVVSDNRHTYGGVKPFYRTIMATYVSTNEFRGL
jgi:hypothetical protein